MEGGQKKIVVKVDDESQLLATLKKANEMKINHCYIRDAGLTQVCILYNSDCKWINHSWSDWTSPQFRSRFHYKTFQITLRNIYIFIRPLIYFNIKINYKNHNNNQ